MKLSSEAINVFLMCELSWKHRTGERKLKTCVDMGEASLATQTFWDTSSRVWEKSDSPWLSFCCYHCKESIQHWKKQEQDALVCSGSCPICSSLLLSLRATDIHGNGIFALLNSKVPYWTWKTSVWVVGPGSCRKDNIVRGHCLQFESESSQK